jgi:hypothetical protein
MKFSAALYLAIAPLAIAKSIHNVYPARRDRHEGKDKSKGSSGGEDTIVAAIEGGNAEEVIIIWVNPGNDAATTTVNQASTVTQTVTETVAAGNTVATAAAAAATHSVTYNPSNTCAVPASV